MVVFAKFKTTAAQDLAVEAKELLQGKADCEISGVSENIEKKDGITIHSISILNQKGAKAMGRDIGEYITIDLPDLSIDNAYQLTESVAKITADCIKSILSKQNVNTDAKHPILIIGLGNIHMSPDALGPRTIQHIQPTAHFYQYLNKDDRRTTQAVSALIPGVLGNTGIDTFDTIKGICDQIHPSCIIAIDALATASLKRIANTIQIADTGIRPGSGISNHNRALNRETLGLPVIAIGIPTVIHAGTIINESIKTCLSAPGVELSKADPNIIIDTIEELLKPYSGDLLVTPKGIDELIDDCGYTLAAAIALAVHPGATIENYMDFLQ